MKEFVSFGAVRVPSEQESLPFLRGWMQDVWKAACPAAPPESLHAFVLAVHEAFRNVIEHGREGRKGPISIELARIEGALVVRLIYDGVAFDGTAAPANFDGSRDRGFGMYLMTRGLSRVSYTTTPEGRQQVELTKSTERPKPAENTSGENQ